MPLEPMSTDQPAAKPDEIVMLCVDCSASMARRCGFPDIMQKENDEEDRFFTCQAVFDMDHERDRKSELAEMKGEATR